MSRHKYVNARGYRIKVGDLVRRPAGHGRPYDFTGTVVSLFSHESEAFAVAGSLEDSETWRIVPLMQVRREGPHEGAARIA